MTLDQWIGQLVAISVFLSLASVYVLIIGPLAVFSIILLVPFFFAVMTPISGAVAIAWAWMWDEQEILGTEPDAVPG